MKKLCVVLCLNTILWQILSFLDNIILIPENMYFQ